MDLLQLMQKARTLLAPHWVLSIGVCLVYGLAVAVPAELNSYGEMLSFLLAGPLQLGLCFFFLNLVRGEETRFELLFEGFKPLLTVLLSYAIIAALTIVGLILLIVPGIIVALGFSMTYYVIADDPEITFQVALEQSWKLTDGYKMELLVLNLRFIPWYLLGLLCLIVGVFAVIPWHNTTLALYYEHLKEQQLSSS
ncbi:DUF975 family protein [Flavobacteriaceae bacterium]|nr:DUF975 family protein [Flavobacteriaceae bacterium]MDB2340893.1 DUF975 family protein [Flavobacteriaceae bacterium]MDC1056226.1 DUF975 family protein [Flavobacteriaceae bacterium]MDC3369049.1 DUF975 family protein [Flavobacteriaceae bacterium]